MNNGGIPQFTNIFTVITNVSNGIALIASAIVGLMIIAAGIYLMVDRATALKDRFSKLDFLKTVLTGYVVILAGNFLVQLLTSALASGGIHR